MTMRYSDEPSTSPYPLRIWLLGGFRVGVGAGTIDRGAWRLRKAAALVKLLALAPGHRLHREQAIDLLWPDSARSRASNNLRQVVYGARRILHYASGPRESYLALKDEQLVMCPDGQLWVDVDAFEEASSTARRSRDASAYRAAIDLYAGDLLPEDRYEEWAEGRRAQLRQLYLALLVELAGLYEVRGEYERGIEPLQKAITEEPALEEVHVSIMRLYALSARLERALDQYDRLRSTLSKEFGTEPSLATRRLRDDIAVGRLPTIPPTDSAQDGSSADTNHNLPAPMTSFVGRERETIEIKRTLSMTRLLTLTGTGGSGKTRLAIEVARDLVGSYPGGVWLVELAPLSDAELVAQEVANILGVQERPGESLTDTLVEALAAKGVLLVLDNCEHLVEEAARLVDKLLASCPQLKVLATSREPLGVSGEVVWAMPPLSLPGDTGNGGLTTEILVRYESVRLFLDRARLRLPDFGLTRENAQAVARVCRKLDGIPLAIELATARMGVLAVEQVAQRLDVSLDVLKGSGRIAAPRQQTLMATLDWSHDLLSEDERMLFRGLSVFAGGWTLEAAEIVCSGDGIEREDVLDLLGGLVDKSLVVAAATTGGSVRYRMLEPVRQYAEQRSETEGEAGAVHRRHMRFYLNLAREAEPELKGAGQEEWVERLEAEHDNLRAALAWGLASDPGAALRLAGTLARFWEIRSYYSEAMGWLEAVLRESEGADAASKAQALTEAGTFAWHQGRYERATALHGEALALHRESGNERGVAFALMCLGTQELEKSEVDRAVPLYEDALSLSQRLGDKRTSAFVLHNLAEVARHRADPKKAIALGTECLTLLREVEDTSMVTIQLGWLGMIAAYHGAHEAAAGFLEEGLPLAREMKNGMCTALCLQGLAALAGAKGNAVRAARLWGAAEALRETVGSPLPPVDLPVHERNVATVRTQVDEDTWEAAFANGQAMTLEEATEYALSGNRTDPPGAPVVREQTTSEPIVDLTRREQEVAVLVARGLTNRQVSRELSISERTAANHAAKILKKLGLNSRAQIGALVVEDRPHAAPQD